MWNAARALRTGALVAALAWAAACGDDDDGGGQGADAGDGSGADAAAPDAGARDAILLPGDAVYPEGGAARSDGTLFIGSLNQGTIFRVPPGARAPQAEPFAEGGDNGLINTIGLLADDARGILWACSSDLGSSPLTGSSPPGLKGFDMDTGQPAGSYDLPGGGFCNDVALDAGGNVYVTDSFAPRVLVLPSGGDALEVWLEDDRFGGEGFNLNGVAVDRDDLYAVKYNTGELFRVPIAADGQAGAAVQVDLGRLLESPDGLRVEAAGTLLVVEGVGRLVRLDLRGDTPALAELAGDLDGPASVALVDRDAWVVETQLAHLIDPDSGPPDLPFKVERVPLGEAGD